MSQGQPASSAAPRKQGKDSADSAYNVFQKVDDLVSKPVSGSTQALHWQTFRQDNKASQSSLLSSSSSAPTAPLSKSQRAAGFASWKDEQTHEASLRRQRNDAPLNVGYRNFATPQEQQDGGLTKKQIRKIQSRIRPDEKEYFIPAATFQGSKFDYVFTTRPERGTGYYWDGTDSVKQLANKKEEGATSQAASISHAEDLTGAKDKEVAPSSADDVDADEPKLLRKKKKRKPEGPVIIEHSNHPLEQIAALMQSRQQKHFALPSGWEQATDAATKQAYYFNRVTGERSWDRPSHPNAISEPAISNRNDNSEWKSATDDVTGKTYYYNASGETRWDDPIPLPTT